MSIILKSIFVLTVCSLIIGSDAQASIPSENIFAIAEKLNKLFEAFSGNKLNIQELNNLQNFQYSLVNAWSIVINTFKNIEPSKAIDALTALVQNQQNLISQSLSIFNLDQLNKWVESFTNTLKNVTINQNNNNNTYTTWYPNYNYTDSTWYWSNTTWYPNNNSTSFTTGSWQNFTSGCNGSCTIPWNSNTTWYPNYNYTDSTWFFGNTTWYPNYNYTDSTFQFGNTTWYPNYNYTDSTWYWSNTTRYPNYNSTSFTTGSWQNFTSGCNGSCTIPSNSNTTYLPSNNTTGFPFNSPSANNSLFTTPQPTTANQVYVDSVFCNYYTKDDCKQRMDISLLCPAKCRCQNHICQNNGTLAISSDLQTCKCLCNTARFTGTFCEVDVCPDKEYCSYFNENYCTNQMINENCPKLCRRC